MTDNPARSALEYMKWVITSKGDVHPTHRLVPIEYIQEAIKSLTAEQTRGELEKALADLATMPSICGKYKPDQTRNGAGDKSVWLVKTKSGFQTHHKEGGDHPSTQAEITLWKMCQTQSGVGDAPQRWKLVPVEPTEEMEDEGAEVLNNFRNSDQTATTYGLLMRIYKAMLAAAPLPQNDEGEV